MKSHTPLRIAQISPLWTRIPPKTYGGVELLLKLLIDQLVDWGHEVTLFGTGDCDTKATLRAICDVNLYDLQARGEAFMFEYYANGLMAEVLREADAFDVIHSHLSPAWLPSAAACRTPVVWTMHTAMHLDDEWALRRYPEVAAVGISKEQMHAGSVRLGREFPVVYNGCDFDAFTPSYACGSYLAFIGRMSRNKNPLGAIRIARAVEIPIVLAGQPQNAEEQQYFTEEIAPLIDDKEVKYIGPANHQQKNELLRNAAALLFPIEWEEPFGLVMIEAMACGCPVVAHRRGSVEEVVDPGITGYYSSVTDAIPELVPKALQLDRELVRKHARERFGYEKMVESYLEIYHRVIRSHGRRRSGVAGS